MMEEDEFLGCISCMSSNNLFDLFSVYEDNGETYASMFKTCFDISLPEKVKFLCSECAEQLEKAFAFREQTAKSLEMLREALAQDEEYLDETILEEDDSKADLDLDIAKSDLNDDIEEDADDPQYPAPQLSECNLCGLAVSQLELHHDRCHGSKAELLSRKYPCHFCENVYKSKKACFTHLRMKHGLKLCTEQTAKFTLRERKKCHLCSRDFSQKQILNKHLWKAHGLEVEKRKAFICPLCSERVSYGAHFSSHLLHAHRVHEHVEQLQFHNMDDFLLYKSAVQEETKFRYRKTTASKQTFEGVRSHYMCSQSGVYVYQVKEVHIAPGFQQQYRRPSLVRFYANDIAVMIVAEPFSFNDHVRPVCINFDGHFQETELQRGAKGKSVRWNWLVKDGAPTVSLLNLFLVVRSDCLDSNLTDTELIYGTDKLCVRYEENNTIPALCVDENSGTGLSFPSVVNGIERYYLQGVYSYAYYLAQWDFRNCNSATLHEFTSLLKHERFIRNYWNESWADPPITGKCVLPPFPEHGSYVTNVTRVNATDGEGYVVVALTVTCQEGYGVLGSSSVNCYNGFWPDSFPTCVRMCPLKPHPSVEYRCLVSGAVVGSRACLAREPPGALVSPRCREPHYYSASTLPFMRCGDSGNWDYVAKCMPECGKVTPDGKELVFGGRTAKRGELPWHAGIYSKITEPYMQICGGSIISNNLIISAAHCFWTDLEKQLPASQFAVAVGKLYRPWNDSADDAQKSDVKEIRLPERFQGAGSNFQDDIAVVILATPFEYKTFVRPVCLSFDYNFDRLQLQTINKGKIAGWGLTSANGKASPILRVVELPYVEVSTCIANSPPGFLEYITSDKICAGTQLNNSALCRGDSGGGFSFPTSDRDTTRYYLRGVVSTAPNNDNACNTATYTSFTHIHKHEDFIKPFLKES